MSKKVFTKREIKILSNNPYVKSVSDKGITYTDQFKQFFISQTENGKFPREIFEDCEFNLEIIGMDRVHSAGKRWRAAYRKDGILGLRDTRIGNSGRGKNQELTPEEKYSRLEVENNLLKAENELLKKIQFAEGRLKIK